MIFWCNTASAISKQYIEESIKKAAKKVGVPADLLKAICSAESNLNPEAFVFNDGGESNAIGMCQILVSTAKDLGLADKNCEKDFRYKKGYPRLDRTYKSCVLFGPYSNALYAARYLKKKLDKYEGSWISAIAAYNSGIPKYCERRGYYFSVFDEKGKVLKPKGTYRKVKCIPGQLLNHEHVDRVLQFLRG